ncbi:MAG: hypothetical protein SFT93_04115 [Rickettsiaceae bacterium]|nr:hypothetical protein [Rickettsiaceae bacterium]
MKNNFAKDKFLSYIIISLLLHIIIIILISFRPNIFEPKSLDEEIIALEILPVANVNNIQTKSTEKPTAEKTEDAKSIKKTYHAETKDEPEEKEGKDKEKIEPEKPSDSPKEMKSETRKPAEPKARVTQKDQPEKKKESKPKQKPKKDTKKSREDRLESLLKNLAEQSDGKNNRSSAVSREKDEGARDAFGKFDELSAESLTNDAIIKQQIMRNWNQPPASSTEEIIIVVRLELSNEGVIRNSNIIRVSCPFEKDVVCDATKDSIIRAVRNSSPLAHLQISDYDSWKEIDIKFDTRR